MMRIALLIGLGAVAACSPKTTTTTESVSISQTVVVSAAPVESVSAQPLNVISAEGYGPLRIGMTRAQVIEALGPDANPNAVGGPDEAACDMFRPTRAPQGFLVMIEKGVLTSVWASRESGIPSDTGLKGNDPATKVKQTYGAALETERHHYVDSPAEYLTTWSTKDRAVRYEIGNDGKVDSIAGGGRSITYVEGCS
ncbi:hypothetical protein ABI_01890 [Asticcacaulis biprosthecium C19]|uniref:Lipoprotein n=1 Tax=Asticcacaulis biprosthecium C19 TaxID=715226 RepID=F4QIC1_9CAUL|nr:hypothetical protein [Asticcacaulis biprosthecium]EGF91759.1 hypothetical protein ABI_01890 [Asticcacaulis biprosthecium C19]